MTFSDGFGIRMLPADELKPVMNDQIQEAVEVLGAPPGAAAILLREHKWAKERLFQSFFDNPIKIQEKCGVLARCRSSGGDGEDIKAGAAGRNTRATAKRRTCEICLDEDGFDPDEMIAMPCGHEFCETCWYGFISNALDKGPLCLRETCPQAGCNELITEAEVCRAAPDLLPKFECYQLRSFVETYGMTRWCPGPGCGQVALACGGGVFSDIGGDAKCNVCEICFCLKCGNEPHAPITCQHLSKWQEKCKNESETANWILANTKPCPKCSSRIEKNQGCNVSLLKAGV
jgi:ariadne-1